MSHEKITSDFGSNIDSVNLDEGIQVDRGIITT